MKLKNLLFMTVICSLSFILSACDNEDFPPSMAELNIEKLQGYHADKVYIIYEKIGFSKEAIEVKDYHIESPYLIVTSIYDYVYSIDMNNVVAFQYDNFDNSVTIWF